MALSLLLLTAAAVVALSPNATASQVSGFQTPSGNVHCAHVPGGSGTPEGLRCDMRKYDGRGPARPADCDFDWIPGASLGRTGRAELFGCVSDSVQSDWPVARYGTTWKRGSFSCTVEKTGVTCTNRSKIGFFLSRRLIRRA